MESINWQETFDYAKEKFEFRGSFSSQLQN